MHEAAVDSPIHRSRGAISELVTEAFAASMCKEMLLHACGNDSKPTKSLANAQSAVGEGQEFQILTVLHGALQDVLTRSAAAAAPSVQGISR